MEPVPFTEKSYWLGTRPYTPGPPLAGDLDVDVAVIGAGYTGLTSAYFIKEAEPGLRVALLEADVVGFGASGRNGGFSMTKVGMMHSITALRFGKARTVEAHQYAERAVDLVHRLVEELGFDCDYEHPGYLWVATSEKHRRRLYKETRTRSPARHLGHLADRLPRTAPAGQQPPLRGRGVVGAQLRHPQPGEAGLVVARRRCGARRRDLRAHPGGRRGAGRRRIRPHHARGASHGAQGGVRHQRLVPSARPTREEAGADLDLHRHDRAAHRGAARGDPLARP